MRVLYHVCLLWVVIKSHKTLAKIAISFNPGILHFQMCLIYLVLYGLVFGILCLCVTYILHLWIYMLIFPGQIKLYCFINWSIRGLVIDIVFKLLFPSIYTENHLQQLNATWILYTLQCHRRELFSQHSMLATHRLSIEPKILSFVTT